MTTATIDRYAEFDIEHIPTKLTDCDQWVAWRAVPGTKADGTPKVDKVPIDAKSGGAAKSNDPSTWSGFDVAVSHARDNGLGIGFVLSKDDPFVGVDLDKCVAKDTSLSDDAWDVIKTMESYTEYSPSDTGVRIIALGELPQGKRKNGNFELYDSGRFLTITGRRMPGQPKTVEERTGAVCSIHSSYISVSKQQEPTQPHTNGNGAGYAPDTIEDIEAALDALQSWRADDREEWIRIGMAVKAKMPNGDGFRAWDAWSKKSSKYQENEMKKRWEGFNPSAITGATLFGLAKDDDPTYRQNGKPKRATVEVHDVIIQPDEDEEQEPHPLDKEAKPVELGRIGEYIELMYELTGAPRSFHQLAGLGALAGAMHNASLPIAFFDSKRGLRPNIYGVIIASSTVYHKSSALRKIHDVMDYDRLLNCARLPTQFTEEGLMSALSEEDNEDDTSSSGIIVKDEVGMLIAAHKRKHLETVSQMLTAIFDGDSFQKRLSGGKTTTVNSPYVNLIGATTPDRFHDGARAIDWADGFLPRFLFALPDSEPDWDYKAPFLDSGHWTKIDAIKEWLVEVHNHGSTSFKFENGQASYAIWDEWYKESAKAAFHSEEGDRVSAIVGRLTTYALKFAMLLSVARKEEWGVISDEALRGGIQLAENYMASAYQLLTESRDMKVDGSVKRRCFNVIKDWQKNNAPGSYPSRREVGQFANVQLASTRNAAIDALLEMGVIDEEKWGRTQRLVATVDKLPAGRL